jgi:glutamyl-tRNA reductase
MITGMMDDNTQNGGIEQQPSILCIGLSHHTAPVELRERLADRAASQLAGLQTALPTIQEWVMLATCNRWELYLAISGTEGEMIAAVVKTLKRAVDDAEGAVEHHLYTYQGLEAVCHLGRVAAGLDSLILGEAQILGQVNTAFADGLETGTVGPALASLFRAAIRAGRRARAETAIGARAATMSAVALATADAQVGALADRPVLVVGAGEMARLATKALHARQVSNVTIANRTLANAEAILLDPRWRAIGLADLAQAIHTADVIFCAARSREMVISAEMLDRANHEPKTLIDLGVPRNIDPAVRHLPGITLIDVDHLQVQLDQGLAARRQAAPAVEAIVQQEAANWAQEWLAYRARPLVVELRQKAEQIRLAELERTLRLIGDVDDDTRSHIDQLTKALVNKLLHEPTVQIKTLAQSGQPDEQTATIRRLFGLQPTSVQQTTAAHDRSSL